MRLTLHCLRLQQGTRGIPGNQTLHFELELVEWI